MFFASDTLVLFCWNVLVPCLFLRDDESAKGVSTLLRCPSALADPFYYLSFYPYLLCIVLFHYLNEVVCHLF